jgi:hypothetical protein
MDDLINAGVKSNDHWPIFATNPQTPPVLEYIHPDVFNDFKQMGYPKVFRLSKAARWSVIVPCRTTCSCLKFDLKT